jgi:hypothetical protein
VARKLFAVVLALALSMVVANAADTSEKLPVRRVVLYKNGVGYFEHTGRVQGTQELKIDFTSSQLNDVLKSLTVLDLNGGKISGVGYNSVAPIAEQLRSLRLPLQESATLAEFLSALRGTRIQVKSDGAVFSGRLLSVEEKTVRRGKDDSEVIKTLEISMITDGDELRTFPLTSSVGVQIADHDINEEIARYLGLVSSARDQDLRRMTISSSGNGERTVFVSYISEVPVWKSTYRIILPTKADAKPMLQGWAIVDNTVGEDWKDVELSLVAGAPQSFIQELSLPLYTRRPEVPLPQAAMLTPQTHEGTMTSNAPAPQPTPKPGTASDQIENLPLQGRNFTQMAELAPGVVGGGMAAPAKSRAGSRGDFNNAAAKEEAADKFEAAAYGQDLGDLFQYNLKEKVTILKNHSALVPIINSQIKAAKVTLWSASSPRPLRALWITNSSGLTLDAGTFNVVEENAFAGEGLIAALKPEERRLLSYAVDQAIRVQHDDQLESRPVTHIKIAKGMLTQTSKQLDHQTYTVRNSDTQPREVVIEHALRSGWKLANDVKPEETSASSYRFAVKVPPSQTTILKIDEVQPLERTVALSSVTDEQIKIWFNDKTLKPELMQALRQIMDKKNEISALDRHMQGLQAQISGITQDQARLRENMKALKGSAEERALVARYTRQLNEQEDKLQAVRAEIARLDAARAEKRQQLDKMLQDLTLDESI